MYGILECITAEVGWMTDGDAHTTYNVTLWIQLMDLCLAQWIMDIIH